MRNSRDRWTFFQHNTKPILSSAEVVYWKNALKKVLKIGKEFEFNLPDQTGNCKGDSSTCPCAKMADEDCWKQCVHVDSCTKTPNIHRCSSRSKECTPEKCTDCKDYKMLCPGIYCQSFESLCFDCEKFEASCKGCPDRYDPERNPKEIRKRIRQELMPSHCYGIVSKCGVHSITRDGSLLGDKGVEVVTVGRRVDYWEFYRMAKHIIGSAMTRGAYMNERCSTHMHILASYYGKIPDPKGHYNNKYPEGIPMNISELEKDIPQIVVANFHQLCRRYQNAMTWMTIALGDPNHMTRWEKFRVSILEISAVLNNMRQVQDMVRRNSGDNKYGWVNYEFCQFSREGDVKRFHVEMRTADGMLCPSAIAALGCMYYALAIKAVEISKYGVLEVGDDEWMSRAKKIKGAILNNVGGYEGPRLGDTSQAHRYFDVLRTESFDLLRQLKHILIRIGPAYNVLERLAERPIALRRCDGESWEQIEKDLEVSMSEESQFEAKVSEYIDLRLIDECKTVEEWVKAVSQALKNDPDFVTDEETEKKVGLYVETKRNEGDLVWSESLGSVVLI